MRYCLTQKLFANLQISAYFLHAKQDFQETTTIKVELKGKKNTKKVFKRAHWQMFLISANERKAIEKRIQAE